MAVSREEIYEALYALLSASPVWAQTGRRLLHWTATDAQPALFLRPYKEEVIPAKAFGLVPHYEMTAEAWVYVQNGDPSGASGTQITDLLDLVDSLLAANFTPDGRQTLGELVFHCWREGETIVASGEPSTQSVAIVPINILVTDLMVPRPKILSVSASPASGTFTTGEQIVLTLGMNTPVKITELGHPQEYPPVALSLNSGGAAFVSGFGTFTSSLVFTYTVAAGDTASLLAITGATLNTASVTDQNGKHADLTIAPGQPAGPIVINPPGG